MPGIPANVLVHVAVPLEYDEPQTATPEWIEGEPGAQGGGQAVRGVPFVCVLFLPAPGGEQQDQYRSRVVQVPTLLHNPTRDVPRAAAGDVPAVPADHSAIALKREMEVIIYAAELAAWTGGAAVRWQLVGEEQPAGAPGTVAIVQAQLRQVEG